MLLHIGSHRTRGERMFQQKDVWFYPEKVFKETGNTYRTAVSVVPSFVFFLCLTLWPERDVNTWEAQNEAKVKNQIVRVCTWEKP